MIFGFGKKKKDVVEEQQEEIEMISFLGAMNGKSANLKENPGLVKMGLNPAREIISDAIARRAMTVRLDPKGDRTQVSLMVDGIPFPGPKLPKQQGLAVTQVLKLLAGLNIQVRDKPQKGGIKAELSKIPYELTIDVAPVPGGERLSVYADNLKTRPEKPDDLIIPESLREKFREYSKIKSGLLLACGSPRSGVTTAAVGLLRSLDAYIFNIYTVHKDGTRDLPYVTAFEWEEGDDLEKTVLRCQRVEADVIFCPPIDSDAVAKVLFEASERTMLVSEFYAKDAAQGLLQLIKWVGDPQVVASQLKGLFTQKLIRKLCDKCKQAYAPNPKLLEKIGLPPKSVKALYRQRVPPQELAKGEVWEPCPKCNDLGYYDRTGMFEFLEMTEGMQSVVTGDATVEAIRAQMKKDKMLTLQQDGLRLVADGTTSLEELQQAFKGPAPAPRKSV